MKYFSLFVVVIVSVVVVLFGCSDEDNETFVTVQGRVDNGTATLPIANAECRFVNLDGIQLATTRADDNGAFQLRIPPEIQGFIGCNPPGLPRLILATFVSTVGITAGETIPTQGFEEVSPRMTVVANILAQTVSSDLQVRKLELQAALEAQDLDLTLLAGAATTLFNMLRVAQVDDVAFSDVGGADGESGDGGGDDSGGDGGGVGGEAGDGAEFSPFVNVPCEFARDLRGDTALEDLLMDGTLDRPELQAIAADVQQPAATRDAYRRQFSQGMQPFANGRRLFVHTNVSGAYFLHVPVGTPGFVICAPAPHLAISAFVRGRQPGETLTDQDVSPPTQIFATFIFPQLLPQDVVPTADNFRSDIGNLREPAAGIVRMEFAVTPQGESLITDIDGDGSVCSLLESPEDASIDYDAAGAASFVATALYKAFLIETRSASTINYDTILTDVLARTDTTGSPRIEAEEEDLEAAGVPDDRAIGLVPGWNACVQESIETRFGTRLLLARLARAGRLRTLIRDANGNAVPNARVAVTGDFVAFDTGGSGCPTPNDALEIGANRVVCTTDENGRVTFVLLGQRSVEAVPVTLAVESADGALRGQLETFFIPPATIDRTITVAAP